MYDIILVRYGEMTLKKKNYRQFLNKMNQNIKMKLKPYRNLKYTNTDYRFYIYLNGENYLEIIDSLNTVVGLASYSLCKIVKPDYDDIADNAYKLLKSENGDKKYTFKVETNRGNKNFPATSIEISQEVSKRVLKKLEGIKVDVRNPEVMLSIDLRTEGTYIYTKTVKGLGGYPQATQGSGLLMTSGGIDSPVAGFLTLKKGVNIKAIHFASPPYTSDMALQKVIDLVQMLSHYTIDGNISLFVVPFTKIQEAIHNNCNHIYLVTLMRRAMYRIAERFAINNKFNCIINGESIGQVASQTLESIYVVNEVTNMPIIRPLATYDKEEIIETARRIKTFDISIRPYEDCCTVFVPEHPIIKPKIDIVLKEEQKYNYTDLIDEALTNIYEIKLNCYEKFSLFKNVKDFEI